MLLSHRSHPSIPSQCIADLSNRAFLVCLKPNWAIVRSTVRFIIIILPSSSSSSSSLIGHEIIVGRNINLWPVIVGAVELASGLCFLASNSIILARATLAVTKSSKHETSGLVLMDYHHHHHHYRDVQAASTSCRLDELLSTRLAMRSLSSWLVLDIMLYYNTHTLTSRS